MRFSRCAFRRSIHLSWLLELCLAALVVIGCGDRGVGVPVNGTVTYQGQPLANAAITFFPEQGKPQTSPLDSQGKYSVRLPPGDYQVTVGVGPVFSEGWKEGDPPPPLRVNLPSYYTQRVRTQLTATVAEGQSEPINFDLK